MDPQVADPFPSTRAEAGRKKKVDPKLLAKLPVSKGTPDMADVHQLGVQQPKKARAKRSKPRKRTVVVGKAVRRGRPFPPTAPSSPQVKELARVLRRIPFRLPDDKVLADAIRHDDPRGVIAMVDWDQYERDLRRAIQPVLAGELASTGRKAYTVGVMRKASGIALRFDFADPRITAWIRKHTGDLITAITSEQRDAIRTVIARAHQSGSAIDDLIPAIRTALGSNALFPAWAQAVLNYSLGLQERGLPQQQVSEMTGAYYERLADQRAYMIARTEVLAAHNEGRMQAWTQLVSDGIIRTDEVAKQWDATYENPCPECDDLDGTQVGLFDDFGDGVDGPPLHPNCRCVLLLVDAGSGGV